MVSLAVFSTILMVSLTFESVDCIMNKTRRERAFFFFGDFGKLVQGGAVELLTLVFFFSQNLTLVNTESNHNQHKHFHKAISFYSCVLISHHSHVAVPSVTADFPPVWLDR